MSTNHPRGSLKLRVGRRLLAGSGYTVGLSILAPESMGQVASAVLQAPSAVTFGSLLFGGAVLGATGKLARRSKRKALAARDRQVIGDFLYQRDPLAGQIPQSSDGPPPPQQEKKPGFIARLKQVEGELRAEAKAIRRRNKNQQLARGPAQTNASVPPLQPFPYPPAPPHHPGPPPVGQPQGWRPPQQPQGGPRGPQPARPQQPWPTGPHGAPGPQQGRVVPMAGPNPPR